MRPSPLIAAAAALLFSPAVFAQDADTFNFAGSNFDQQGSLQLTHPEIGEGGSAYAGLGIVYAQNPLVLRYDPSLDPVMTIGMRTLTLLSRSTSLRSMCIR